MIAVLMASAKVGSSSWSAVRGRTQIHAHGLLKGDLVKIFFFHEESGRESWIELEENFILEIPKTCSRIKAEHIETTGNPVYIDLR